MDDLISKDPGTPLPSEHQNWKWLYWKRLNIIPRQVQETYDLQMSHTIICKIFKYQSLYPYHIQRVQELLNDFPRRIELCQWIQNQSNYYLQMNATFGERLF